MSGVRRSQGYVHKDRLIMIGEQKAVIQEVVQRTHNVKSIRLDVGEKPQFKAGQFLSVTLENNPALKRYLSISNSPTEDSYLEFTKKITDSDFSAALDRAKPGDTITVSYPMGKFTLDDPKGKIAFISGGIGITPIRSIAKYVVDMQLGTDMVLLYANQSLKDIIFKDNFEAMQKAYPKLKVSHVLCEAEPGFRCTIGRINSQIIRDEIPDFFERRFFLCGPPAMVEAMCRILTDELKITQDNIITENFQGY